MTTEIDSSEVSQLRLTVPPELAGGRLDKTLATLLPDHSRATIQGWIRAGRVLVDARVAVARAKVRAGDRIDVSVPDRRAGGWAPEPIELDVVYEDGDVLVVNKPAELVVHPGAGNPDGTLANALVHHAPGLAALPRAGVVHRLDKDTTGLLVVALTEPARLDLIDQLEARLVERTYVAVTDGRMISGGTVDAPIGRHPRDRRRMAVSSRGKRAITHYRVTERFPAHTLVEVRLESGRTHQIRVHMAHRGFPLVGDRVYGRARVPAGAPPELVETLRTFPRQALHARRLAFTRPGSSERLSFDAPLPADLDALVEGLRRDAIERGPA